MPWCSQERSWTPSKQTDGGMAEHALPSGDCQYYAAVENDCNGETGLYISLCVCSLYNDIPVIGNNRKKIGFYNFS